MKSLVRSAAAFGFITWLSLYSVVASAAPIIVIPDNAAARQIASEMQSQLVGSKILTDLTDIPTKSKDAVIAVGNETFAKVAAMQLRNPVLASFVSYSSFKRQVGRQSASGFAAVYLEPEPRKLVEAYKANLKAKPLAYIYEDPKDPYLKLLRETGLQLVEIQLIDGDVFRTLSYLYKTGASAGLLLSEERNIYSRNNILLVLESLFRNRMYSVGTNRALHGKGVLLTLASDRNEIVRRTIELAKIIETGEAPPMDNFVNAELMLDTSLAKGLDVAVGGIHD